jgi:cytochrome c oxidase cbb3-type subunit III
MARIEKDEATGTDTTGHEWDGIKELNTPLPRWWINTFYITVAWAAVYCILFPSLPGWSGVLGYSSRANVQEQLAEWRTQQQAFVDRINSTPLEEIRKQADLLEFANAGGAAAFKVNCVPCHGSGAQGGKGYPNLADNEWIWGGKVDDIYTTLKHGIRYTADPETRDSQMPAFGDGILEPAQIADVSDYVLTLQGDAVADTAAVERGKAIFAEQCASCHAEDGKGNRELGAPNLTDKVHLYATTRDQLISQISKPRMGVMPGWTQRLDDATIKQLSVYVHSLGGGEASN